MPLAQPDEGYRRDSTTWVAFAALFGFGVLNALLGPVLPYLRQAEHLSYVGAALHQVAFSIGGTTAGLLASRSTAPRRRTICVGLTAAGAAGVLLGYGRAFALTLAAALLVSFFATAALIRLWALLSDLHRADRAVAMTEGEIAVSLAGIVVPIAVSVCAATRVGWRFSFVLAVVVVTAAAVAVATIELPQPGPPLDPGDAAGAAHQGGRRATRRTLATVFCIVGLEFTLSLWAASYLHDDVGIARDTSVALVSALYAANMVGRLITSRLARRLPVVTLLRLCLVTALAGMPLLLGAGNAAVAGVGLAVTGLGVGGTFPLASALHVAASRRSADQALGQILTVAGLGQICGPLAAAALAQPGGLRVGLLVLPALVLLVLPPHGAPDTVSETGPKLPGMVELPPHPFPATPTEVEALVGALHRNRRTFAWKTGGLDADALRRTLGPSTLTLGGLIKHLALVEDHYFTHQLHGRDYPAVWAPMATDENWEWKSAANDSAEDLRDLWLAAVARSQVAVDEALADGGLDRELVISDWPEKPSLRRVLVDLIEEYARHTGHADLIRESIDGLVGEDAPQ